MIMLNLPNICNSTARKRKCFITEIKCENIKLINIKKLKRLMYSVMIPVWNFLDKNILQSGRLLLDVMVL